jgi:hypothetical protein
LKPLIFAVNSMLVVKPDEPKNPNVMKSTAILIIVAVFLTLPSASAQHQHHRADQSTIAGLEPQPLLAQAFRLKEALSFLGSSLSAADEKRLEELKTKTLNAESINIVQQILDPYCLAVVNINPEARVKVTRGSAAAKLIQDGWTTFLVKVVNEAGSTAPLNAESPNGQLPVHAPTYESRVKEKDIITQGQVANRFIELQVYRNRPLLPNLSGLKLEYCVVQIYSRDKGQREAEIGFNIGQGTQDIGFRNTIPILFTISPSVKVNLKIKDENGSPAMASLIITDGVERVISDSTDLGDVDYVHGAAQKEFRYGNQKIPSHLRGIYPLPSRRVAAVDEYPDFFFQPQVYRSDGEHISLPPGKYNVTVSHGPEYITERKELIIPQSATTFETAFELKRWIDLSKLGYYSADHHIHGAGCSHYNSPEEGVPPDQMWRQVLGENLNVAANLAWGPSWYHQKTFFTGKDLPLSSPKNIMRNDVEVSGFPSSHAGHIVLLRIKEDDYPNTTLIEEWPSWTLPVLQWAKSQGGVVGYAHSGWGLEPQKETGGLIFNDVIPKMDGIGANEYIVTVTHDAVDFFSLGDTPAPWELNMWYHTLNAGFRTRASGETDFPCIYDERVGLARSYFKCDGALSYDKYVDALKTGRGYISEGGSHIIDFSINNQEVGTGNSELKLKSSQEVKVKARVAALLSLKQSDEGAAIAKRHVAQQPYWHIERARINQTQNVRVELLVNGFPVDTTVVTADGKINDVSFSYAIKKSAWVALRVYHSSHTNPIFVEVGGKPVRELKSAEWCRKVVDQCWKMKEGNIRSTEKEKAREAYEKARGVYDRRAEETN